MKPEHAFQAGWRDVLDGQGWRRGYHKWRPNAQVQYETGRLAAVTARVAGVSLERLYHDHDLPAQVLACVNDEREMKRKPPVEYGRLPFVPKVVSLT